MSGLFRAARVAGPAALARHVRIVGQSSLHGRRWALAAPPSRSLLLRRHSGVLPHTPHSNQIAHGGNAARALGSHRSSLEFMGFRRMLFRCVKAEDANGFWTAVETSPVQMTLAHFGCIFSVVGSMRLFYGKRASLERSRALVDQLSDFVHFSVAKDGLVRELSDAADAATMVKDTCDLFHGFQWLDPAVHGNLLALLARDLLPYLDRGHMTTGQVAHCLYKLHSMGHLLSGSEESRSSHHDAHYHRLIATLGNKLEPSSEALTLSIACGLFLSTGNASNDHPAVRKLLRVATNKLKEAFSGADEGERFIQLDHLTRVLSGVRAMTVSDRPEEARAEVIELLNFVATLRLESGAARSSAIDSRSRQDNRSPRYSGGSEKEDFVHTNGAKVSVVLNTLRNFTAAELPAVAVVRMLDRQLVQRLPPSCSLDAGQVGRALQGLRFMDMADPHCASVVSFLCAQLRRGGACSPDDAKAIIYNMSNIRGVGDTFLLHVLPHILDNSITGTYVVLTVRTLKNVLAASYSSPAVTPAAKEAVWAKLIRVLLSNDKLLDLWTERDVIKILREATSGNQLLLGELLPVLVRVLSRCDKRVVADPSKRYEWTDKDLVGCLASLAVFEGGGVHCVARSADARALSELVVHRIYKSSRAMERVADGKAAEVLSPAVQGVLQLVTARNQALAEDSRLVRDFGYDLQDLSLGLRSIKGSLPLVAERPRDLEAIKSSIRGAVVARKQEFSEPRPSQLYPTLDFSSSMNTLRQLASKDDSFSSEFWGYVEANASKFNVSHISLIFGLCAANFQVKPGYMIRPSSARTLVNVLHQRLQLSSSDQDAVTARAFNSCLRGISAVHFHPKEIDVATLQTWFRSLVKMSTLLQLEPMTVEEISGCLYPLRHGMLQQSLSSVLCREATPLLSFLAGKLEEADTLVPSEAKKPMTIAQIAMCLSGIQHFASTHRLETQRLQNQPLGAAIGTILRAAADHLRERRMREAAAIAEGAAPDHPDPKAHVYGEAHLKRLMLMVSCVRGLRVKERGDPLAAEVLALVEQVNSTLRALSDRHGGQLPTSTGSKGSPRPWQELFPLMISGISNKSDAFPEVAALMGTMSALMLPALGEGSRIGIGALLKCYWALRGMDCANEQVRTLLHFFTARVAAFNRGCGDPTRLQEAPLLGKLLGTCIYYAKSMKNHEMVYPDLVDALLGAEDGAEGALLPYIDAGTLASMLPPVYNPQITARVAQRARRLTGPWTADSISTMLHNLQNYSSDEASVRALLAVLADRMSCCSTRFSVTNLLACLGGLRGLSSAHTEVRALLVQLTVMVRRGSEQSTESARIEQALSSLNHLDVNQEEVVDLVLSLTALVHEERVAPVLAAGRAGDLKALGLGLEQPVGVSPRKR